MSSSSKQMQQSITSTSSSSSSASLGIQPAFKTTVNDFDFLSNLKKLSVQEQKNILHYKESIRQYFSELKDIHLSEKEQACYVNDLIMVVQWLTDDLRSRKITIQKNLESIATMVVDITNTYSGYILGIPESSVFMLIDNKNFYYPDDIYSPVLQSFKESLSQLLNLLLQAPKSSHNKGTLLSICNQLWFTIQIPESSIQELAAIADGVPETSYPERLSRLRLKQPPKGSDNYRHVYQLKQLQKTPKDFEKYLDNIDPSSLHRFDRTQADIFAVTLYNLFLELRNREPLCEDKLYINLFSVIRELDISDDVLLFMISDFRRKIIVEHLEQNESIWGIYTLTKNLESLSLSDPELLLKINRSIQSWKDMFFSMSIGKLGLEQTYLLYNSILRLFTISHTILQNLSEYPELNSDAIQSIESGLKSIFDTVFSPLEAVLNSRSDDDITPHPQVPVDNCIQGQKAQIRQHFEDIQRIALRCTPSYISASSFFSTSSSSSSFLSSLSILEESINKDEDKKDETQPKKKISSNSHVTKDMRMEDKKASDLIKEENKAKKEKEKKAREKQEKIAAQKRKEEAKRENDRALAQKRKEEAERKKQEEKKAEEERKAVAKKLAEERKKSEEEKKAKKLAERKGRKATKKLAQKQALRISLGKEEEKEPESDEELSPNIVTPASNFSSSSSSSVSTPDKTTPLALTPKEHSRLTQIASMQADLKNYTEQEFPISTYEIKPFLYFKETFLELFLLIELRLIQYMLKFYRELKPEEEEFVETRKWMFLDIPQLSSSAYDRNVYLKERLPTVQKQLQLLRSGEKVSQEYFPYGTAMICPYKLFYSLILHYEIAERLATKIPTLQDESKRIDYLHRVSILRYINKMVSYPLSEIEDCWSLEEKNYFKYILQNFVTLYERDMQKQAFNRPCSSQSQQEIHADTLGLLIYSFYYNKNYSIDALAVPPEQFDPEKIFPLNFTVVPTIFIEWHPVLVPVLTPVQTYAPPMPGSHEANVPRLSWLRSLQIGLMAIPRTVQMLGLPRPPLLPMVQNMQKHGVFSASSRNVERRKEAVQQDLPKHSLEHQ